MFNTCAFSRCSAIVCYSKAVIISANALIIFDQYFDVFF